MQPCVTTVHKAWNKFSFNLFFALLWLLALTQEKHDVMLVMKEMFQFKKCFMCTISARNIFSPNSLKVWKLCEHIYFIDNVLTITMQSHLVPCCTVPSQFDFLLCLQFQFLFSCKKWDTGVPGQGSVGLSWNFLYLRDFLFRFFQDRNFWCPREFIFSRTKRQKKLIDCFIQFLKVLQVVVK